MFSRLTRWFLNLRFGFKLLFGFGIMVLLSAVIGVAALTTGTITSNSADEANTDSKHSALAEQIQSEMEAARDDEAGYFLNYAALGLEVANSRYVVKNQEHVGRVRELLVELQQELDPNDPGHTQVLRLLVLAEDQAKAYQSAFDHAVTSTQERGLAESGLIGDLRTAAHALEGSPALADPALQVTLLEMRRYEKDYMLYGAQASIDSVHEFNAQLQDQINALDSADAQKSELIGLANAYLVSFDALIDKDHEIATSVSNLGLISNNVNQLLGEVAAEEVAAVDSAMADVQSVQTQARIINIIALLLVVLAGFGLALLLIRLLTRQVREVERVFSDVRVGEFGVRAKIFGKDELGQVADGVNALLEQMLGLLQEAEVERQVIETERTTLEAAVSKLAQEVGQLATGDLSTQADVDEAAITRAIAEALNYAVGELRGLVLGVENTTVDLTEASVSLSEVVQAMVEQANSSAQTAERASASAHEGDRVVGETIAAMSRIRDNTQETAQRIKRLGEVSQEISEFVRLIEEIADRTTILALNASIQAAAAGDAGRGFAVVAEEVQRLAERATSATREIEDLVKNIQAETNQAVRGVEEATREVVGGTQLAQQAGDRMAELNELVSQLADMIQETAETTAKQTGASVATLTDLSRGLQTSVAAFGLPGSDGHRRTRRDGGPVLTGDRAQPEAV